jgi:hypothetical protein
MISIMHAIEGVVRASQNEPSFLVVAALLGSQIRTTNT